METVLVRIKAETLAPKMPLVSFAASAVRLRVRGTICASAIVARMRSEARS